MKHSVQKFVLFGATGDLSQRMVWPSLYHLCREKLVPPTLTFVGSARNPMPNDEFRKFVDGALRKHVPAGISQGRRGGGLADAHHLRAVRGR